MSTKLQYLYGFTMDDVAENRMGELSDRQIDDLLQPVGNAFGLMIQSIVISIVGILLIYALSTVENLPIWVQIGMMICAAVMGILPILAYINYHRANRWADQGDVGTLSHIRKRDFVRFVDEETGEALYRYVRAEATIIFDDETFDALEPETFYNIYYWTDTPTGEDMGNDVLSIEVVGDGL